MVGPKQFTVAIRDFDVEYLEILPYLTKVNLKDMASELIRDVNGVRAICFEIVSEKPPRFDLMSNTLRYVCDQHDGTDISLATMETIKRSISNMLSLLVLPLSKGGYFADCEYYIDDCEYYGRDGAIENLVIHLSIDYPHDYGEDINNALGKVARSVVDAYGDYSRHRNARRPRR